MIGYGHQDIRPEDVDAVVEVLRSEFITQGPAVPRFEEAVADRVGASRGVAVNSATAALHIAYMALDLGPGDVLWTVPNTFVATANAARFCGADVDFVDIDRDTWNLDVGLLRSKLEGAERIPKVVVPVHFAGQPTDQEEIWELAEEYGFRVVEDASHAVGASRNGEPVGSCRWSDITVFSFHPVKIITTAEGGLTLTNDAGLAERMAMLRNHGITRDATRFRGDSPGPWYHEQHELGFNYRITDIQAALGTSQLARLEEYVARRNLLAARYDEALAIHPLRLPVVKPENVSAFHLYVIRVGNDAGITHREAFDGLRSHGIGVSLHYLPVHLQPYYRDLGFGDGMFPEAEAYGREAITIPLYPAMTDDQQEQVIAAVEKVLERQR